MQSGGAYLFSNLFGCDGDRVFYDGGSMISLNGQIVAEGPQFTLDEVVSLSSIYCHSIGDFGSYKLYLSVCLSVLLLQLVSQLLWLRF